MAAESDLSWVRRIDERKLSKLIYYDLPMHRPGAWPNHYAISHCSIQATAYAKLSQQHAVLVEQHGDDPAD